MGDLQLDFKFRGKVIQKIAVRLGEIKKEAPESQLVVARQFEDHIFKASKSIDEYHRKIEKRLTKASEIANKNVVSDGETQVETLNSTSKRARTEEEQNNKVSTEASKQMKRHRTESDVEERARLLKEHEELLEWFASKKYKKECLVHLEHLLEHDLLEYSQRKRTSICALIEKINTSLEKNAQVASSILQVLKNGKLDQEKQNKLASIFQKLNKRRDHLHLEINKYCKVYAPQMLIDFHLDAFVSDLSIDDDDIRQLLIDTVGTCLSRIEQPPTIQHHDHQVATFLFAANNDGFAARIKISLVPSHTNQKKVVSAITLLLTRYDEFHLLQHDQSSHYLFWQHLSEKVNLDAQALAAQAAKDQRSSATTAPAYIITRLLVIIAHRIAQACTDGHLTSPP